MSKREEVIKSKIYSIKDWKGFKKELFKLHWGKQQKEFMAVIDKYATI